MYCSTLKDVFHHSIKAVVVLIVIKMVIGKVKKNVRCHLEASY